jgi:hypothetical protein
MTSLEPADCRICRETTAPLLQPCRCASHVHQACLRQWTEQRAQTVFPLTFSPAPPSCEVCLAPYAAKPPAGGGGGAAAAPAALSFLLGPDPLSLLPRHAACSAVVTLELCVLLCLFVLSVAGHAIFLIHLPSPSASTPGVEQYAAQRTLLALLNACLTFGILGLVRKIVARWLRDAAPFSPPPAAAAPPADPSSPPLPAAAPPATGAATAAAAASGGAPDWPVGYVTLSAFLSFAAGAEMFLLMSAL